MCFCELTETSKHSAWVEKARLLSSRVWHSPQGFDLYLMFEKLQIPQSTSEETQSILHPWSPAVAVQDFFKCSILLFFYFILLLLTHVKLAIQSQGVISLDKWLFKARLSLQLWNLPTNLSWGKEIKTSHRHPRPDPSSPLSSHT